MSSKQPDPQLAEISQKLEMLISLNALNIIRGIKIQKDQIELLSDAGMGPKQISRLLRTSENTVNVALNRIRKERARPPLTQDTVNLPATQTEAHSGGAK